MDEALVGGVRVTAPRSHSGLFETIRADFREMAAVKAVPFPSLKSVIDIAMLPGTWAVLTFRVAHSLHTHGLRPVSRLLYFANVVMFGFDVAPGANIGPGFVVPHPVGVAISSDTCLGRRNRVLRVVALGGSGDPTRPGSPRSGDDVWFMDNSKVFGAVHIGDRSILGTLALVTTDVQSDLFVFGARRSSDMKPLAELGLDGHQLRDSSWTLRTEPPDVIDTLHIAAPTHTP